MRTSATGGILEETEKVTLGVRDFPDLIAWQLAHRLMLEVYGFCRQLPSEEKYGRVTQLRRAAASVPANIAEGYGRYHYQENIQFCRHARGSLDEIRSHVMAVRDLLTGSAREVRRALGIGTGHPENLEWVYSVSCRSQSRGTET